MSIRRRRAKIVATLGPASSTAETIADLYDAGADVFRLNFSHGTHEDHAARVADIRALEKDVGRPIGILMDLQGPKWRSSGLKFLLPGTTVPSLTSGIEDTSPKGRLGSTISRE